MQRSSLLVVLCAAALLLAGCGERGQAGDLTGPVAGIGYEVPGNHLHGVAFDHRSGELILASHFGLFVLVPADGAWELYQRGESRDDYMGMAMHADDPDILYVSGHPREGGNLGVLRSEDGGLGFERLFTGVADEIVDFHAMTLSPAAPEHLYSFHAGMLYRSANAGGHWERLAPEGLSGGGPCWGVPCLAAHRDVAGLLYAGTTAGLWRSDDGGERWRPVPGLEGEPVGGVGVGYGEPPLLLAATLEDGGVARSTDVGASWARAGAGLNLRTNEFLFAFAFDPGDAQRVFAASTLDRVFESGDGGQSWRRIL